MKIACVFPGQGSQKVGMCKDLYDTFPVAKEVFDSVDDALNQNLSKIIFEGPNEELTSTENTQPALMACSMAILKVLEEKLGRKLDSFCSYLLGHSLGEFTALTAAGSISVTDCAKILKIRGKAMQEAVPAGKGAMFALLGANIGVAKEISIEAGCEVANDNSPEQQVLSGTVQAIDTAIQIASSKGYKAIRLQVSAPFHSKLMSPAAEKLQQALESIQINKPSIPIIANITSDILEYSNIRQNLTLQVTGLVRWCESIKKLPSLGVNRVFEIGPGKVYTNLNKRIDATLESISSDELLASEDIAKYLP